jgi:hypothetical protein
MSSNSTVHVVVLTGNERQAKRSATIQELVDAESTRIVCVELITPDWSRNWGRILKGFRRSLTHADAAVLGTYMPTELGAAARDEVRRLHIPHVRTSKLGQHGLAAAVLAAAELAA